MPCHLNDFAPFCLDGIEDADFRDRDGDFVNQCHMGSEEVVMGDKKSRKRDGSVG